MSTFFIKFVKYLTLFCIVIWVFGAIAVFGLWKNFYYYPRYNLYIYANGGIVGNRTLLLGEDPNSLNTILRYDTRKHFCCYIAKAEGHYYIYWPEDTTSYQYDSVIKYVSSSSFTSEMKKVHYDAYLRDYHSTDTLFSLVTYVHLSPDNWIDNYKTYTDTLYWWAPGQLKIDQALRLSAINPNEDANLRKVSIAECGLMTYMKNFFKALDERTILFVLVLLVLIMLYYFLVIIGRRKTCLAQQ